MRLLEIREISKRFEGITALNKVTFTASEGQLKAIIGPNGAGKTTLFNVISGLIHQDSGNIYFDGLEISTLKPYSRARLGIGRTFQKAFVFEGMTVFENVLVIAENLRKGFSKLYETPERITESILRRVGLHNKKHLKAELLSSGERHLLEIARALALNPKILLLDEPAAGLNDAETENLGKILQGLASEGYCVLLVEHDMKFVMNYADEVLVLHRGEKIAEGPPLLIREDKIVIEAYLGSDILNA
ncbi:MAG: ABC transporter ATP-binding protein [Actinobacteria bacterium]|nr:ABC transporter ATP-binding protein [Actinomycetota bacterium]